MIKKFGVVIVTDDGVTITNFHFDGVGYNAARLEALAWAAERIQAAVQEGSSPSKASD